MTYKDFEKKWKALFKKKSYERPSGLCSLNIDEQNELFDDMKVSQSEVNEKFAKERALGFAKWHDKEQMLRTEKKLWTELYDDYIKEVESNKK